MAFTPGSPHTVRVTVRNTGGAPATLDQGLWLTITPDVGELFAPGGAVIPPGNEVVWSTPFTISPSAVPGRQNTWDLRIPYDGRTLTAQGVAFTVEAPLPTLVSFYAAIRNLPTAFGWTKWQPLWSRGLSPSDPNWDVWEPGSPGPISESERGRFVNYPSRGWYGWKYYNSATGQWSGLYTPYWGELEGILTVWEGATVWGDASSLAVWIE